MKTIALLRAVNVGGTGKLPMAELKAMAEELGFKAVRTYIASGNLLFDAGGLSEAAVKDHSTASNPRPAAERNRATLKAPARRSSSGATRGERTAKGVIVISR